MSISFTQMKAKTKDAQIDWEGEKVDFAYHPAAFSVEVAQHVQERAQEGDLGGVAVVMVNLLDWWDVLDDEGNRLAVTEELVRQMPLGFLMSMLNAVGADMAPPTRRA